jgi:hypothetical protein
MSKISGPLLDRIGIQMEVPAHYRGLRSLAEDEPSSAIRQIPDSLLQAATAFDGPQVFNHVTACHDHPTMEVARSEEHTSELQSPL